MHSKHIEGDIKFQWVRMPDTPQWPVPWQVAAVITWDDPPGEQSVLLVGWPQNVKDEVLEYGPELEFPDGPEA